MLVISPRVTASEATIIAAKTSEETRNVMVMNPVANLVADSDIPLISPCCIERDHNNNKINQMKKKNKKPKYDSIQKIFYFFINYNNQQLKIKIYILTHNIKMKITIKAIKGKNFY